MSKRNVLKATIIFMMFFLCVGCSKGVKEKDIMNDLTTYYKEELQNSEEKINEVVIDKNQVDEENGINDIWCTLVTENSNKLYEKEAVLQYRKNGDNQWVLSDVDIEDSTGWIVSPLKGVTINEIPETLDGEILNIDNEPWDILKNEVTDISVDKQDTNLKEKNDSVIMTLTLQSEVEKVRLKLNAKYSFDDEWKISDVSVEEVLGVESIPGKELNIKENDLIESLTQEKITYGNDPTMTQEITINKNEVSNIKIEKEEVMNKGTERKYTYSCILNKGIVEFNLQVVTSYIYYGEWGVPLVEITPNVKSVNIKGKWNGKFNEAGGGGNVTLDITKLSENKIEASYYYYPNKYSQQGSYNVAGEIDNKTLMMKLKAGNWIEKPNKDTLIKQDITAVINVDKGIIEGLGHHGNVFKLSK